AAFDARQWNDCRKRRGDALEEWEEIVGTVHLVDLARLGVPDHQRRTIDPPGERTVVAHDAFGVVLGPKVRIVEIGRLVEHVLAKGAGIAPRDGDRADMVEAAGADVPGGFDRVLRTGDIGLLQRRITGAQVVEAADVKEMSDLPAQLGQLLRRQPQMRGAEIADHRNDRTVAGAPSATPFLEARQRLLAHQDEDLAHRSLEELLDQVAADETRPSSDEVSVRSACCVSSLLRHGTPSEHSSRNTSAHTFPSTVRTNRLAP